ncbi:MAG: flagellar export chaperone FliS [Treponemataceae bacterium]|nr:flagellar export chaperone FliS [Treponemataceae bacterium]
MAYPNAYSAYKETGVKTASQGKLILMLYDEVDRQLDTAESYFDENSKVKPGLIEKLNSCIVKSQEIITELMISLDMDRGGEVAKNLMSLYVFFNRQLMSANISHDKTKITSVKSMMNELYTAWKTAVATTAPVSAPSIRTNINING